MEATAGLKPFSEACERNRAPILERLRELFAVPGRVLEIGSGTGQHAVYFARQLPQLTWQCSDLAERHAGINAWLDEARLPNVRAPMTLDVGADRWPTGRFEYVFSANTAHIMSESCVSAMIEGVGRLLSTDGCFVIYGPFNENGRFTSESNRRFDASLRGENPAMGLRDRNVIASLAAEHGLLPDGRFFLPANNQLLVFRKS